MPLLTWSYWFSFQAQELMPAAKLGLLAAFGGLFLLGIAARVMASKKSGDMSWAEGGRRFSKMALWLGVVGLLFLLFTHELAYFFGARFWFLIWALCFIAWLATIVKFLIFEVPKKKAVFAERARIDKWLPKSK